MGKTSSRTAGEGSVPSSLGSATSDQAALDQAALDQAALDQAALDQAVLDQGGLDVSDQITIDPVGLEHAADRPARSGQETDVVASDGDGGLSRRDLLGGPWRRLAPLGLAVGAGALAAACKPGPNDPGFHYVKRLTYGLTDAALERVGNVGRDAWLDEQLDPASLDTSALDAKLAAFPALGMTAAQLKAAYPDNAGGGLQLQVASFVRQVHSPAQLFERMVEFWSDHFNVPIESPVSSWLKVVEDREVIRRHALGRFSDLLVASASSPAMLYYLDGAFSVAGSPNENYGRELLELHTVGVDGGYTEADVKAAARLLTGWTIDPATGLFQFVESRHDPSPLTIMGWQRPTSGGHFEQGVLFLQYLARHPSTAQHLATKLATRFVGDRPDAGLVSAVAAAYLANDTAIVPTLRALVAHPAFAASARTRFRRPLHQAAAVLRAVGADLTITASTQDLRAVGGLAVLLGQVPFGWPAPNGYPDAEGAWLTTGGLLARWNATGTLLSGPNGVTVDWARLSTGLGGRSPAGVVDGYASKVLYEPVTAATRDAMVANLFQQPPATVTQEQATGLGPLIATMLLCTPDAQYC